MGCGASPVVGFKRAVVHAVCGTILCTAGATLVAGCAGKQRPPAPTRVEVSNETAYQQPTRRLASTMPSTRPAAQQPKLIEEGLRSTLIYPCRFARTEVLGE